jgi:hypothetical protein
MCMEIFSKKAWLTGAEDSLKMLSHFLRAMTIYLTPSKRNRTGETQRQRMASDEEAHRPPQGKRATWSGSPASANYISHEKETLSHTIHTQCGRGC